MKREAQKIVEAQLNAALDRNDSEAVREACIVLQAVNNQFELPGYKIKEIKDIVEKYLNEEGGEEKAKAEIKSIVPGYLSKDEDIDDFYNQAKESIESGHSLY